MVYTILTRGGAHGVIGTVIGNGYGDPSSNPEQSGLHFTKY